MTMGTHRSQPAAAGTWRRRQADVYWWRHRSTGALVWHILIQTQSECDVLRCQQRANWVVQCYVAYHSHSLSHLLFLPSFKLLQLHKYKLTTRASYVVFVFISRNWHRAAEICSIDSSLCWCNTTTNDTTCRKLLRYVETRHSRNDGTCYYFASIKRSPLVIPLHS